jgi:hypothetical protein
MTEAAVRGDLREHVPLIRDRERAKTALELLIAQARLGGNVTDQERGLLVSIADRLAIKGDDFAAVYKAGILRADEIRKRRGYAK